MRLVVRSGGEALQPGAVRVHFSEYLSELGQRILIICSPMSSPTSRGVCTLKRRRFNGLGKMKACLQSRCSPS